MADKVQGIGEALLEPAAVGRDDVIHVRDLEPLFAEKRHGDRRKAPRRAEDAGLHYAREALIVEALAVVDRDPGAFSRLRQAADLYRQASA